MALPDDVVRVSRNSHAKAFQYPEVRATFLPEHGVFSVPSYSRPGAAYAVSVEHRPDLLVWFSCSCRAGEFRTDYPIPCWHAAVAGRELQAMLPGVIYQGQNGLYYPTDQAKVTKR